MSEVASQLLIALGRTTLWLALAAVVTLVVLRLVQPRSATVHRVAWTIALAIGWSFLRLSVPVPWYDAQVVTAGLPAPARVATIEPVADPPAYIEPLPAEKPLPAPAVQALSRPSMAESRPAGWRFDWPLLAVCVWMAGAIALVAIWLIGYVRFVRRLPSPERAESDWQDQWREMLTTFGVRRQIPLRVTSELGPMLCRLPRGYELLVPGQLWRELDADQRAAILRHELAHYLRGDVWKSLAVRVLALPHWFNPASWLAVRRFEEAAEWACDRVATGDAPPTAYAKALMRLGEAAGGGTVYGPAAHGRTLAARIRRLINSKHQEDSAVKKTLLIVMGLCLATLPLVRWQLVAKEPKSGLAQPSAPGEPGAARELKLLEDINPAEPAVSPPGQPAPEKDLFQLPHHYVQQSNPYAPPGNYPAQAQPFAGPTVSPYLNLLQADGALELNAPKAEPAPEPVVLTVARQKLIDAARKAYEATQAAYQGETAGLEAVWTWSQRWMTAAMDATSDPKQKVAAVEAHLERMRQMQKRIKELYEVGIRGGNVEQMAVADFYVADAERRLAEIAPIAPAQSRDPRGAGLIVPGQTPTLPPTGARHRGSSAPSNKDLRYDGKDFQYWSDLLRKELSPPLRVQAIGALMAFGANGFGREAATEIIQAMGRYTTWPVANRPKDVRDAALFAIRELPRGDTEQALIEALKKEDSKLRQFALSAAFVGSKEMVPAILECLKDKDLYVREAALFAAGSADPDAPQVREALLSALKDEDPNIVVTAIGIICGRHMPYYGRCGPIRALFPEVIALLAHRDNGVIRHAAADGLAGCPNAVDELEKALKSDNPQIAARAGDVLKKIREHEAEKQEPKSGGTPVVPPAEVPPEK